MFDFDQQSRKEILSTLLVGLEEYFSRTKDLRVSSEWDVSEIKSFARDLSFDDKNTPTNTLQHVLTGLSKFAVHTTHPNYFGLFNPRTGFASIMGDLIAATFNPQMAAWSHSPYANEVERYIIEEFGKKFGYPNNQIDGTFCSGGAESNLTAVICALNHFFPAIEDSGVRGIEKQPLIYCSSESHHSIVKAAKMTGLGTNSVRSISVDSNLTMNLTVLNQQIIQDRQDGFFPFLIVGTAGTTGAGSIDDLNGINQIAKKENLWFHVDGAYGGGVIISEKYGSCLSGIEMSDSITLDLHKWFSVPMGGSLFLTSNLEILRNSFRISTAYMPQDGDPDQVVDPYVHSVQWSRRFIGLKAYLPLAIHGWKEYEDLFDRHIEMGHYFRNRITENGWQVVNKTELPVICFKHATEERDMVQMVNNINATGKTWFSNYPVKGVNTARVCFNNYNTGISEVDELVDLIEKYGKS